MVSDRSCPSGKRTYDKKSAVTQLNREGKRAGGKKLHIYHCAECNHWHLGRNVDYMKGYKRR
jgi:hypothetical protein